MINFRYHIVSLIAVFLALAIGVIMGSAVIDRAIVNRLEDQQRSLESRLTGIEKQNDELKAENGDLRDTAEQLADQGSQRLLANSLLDVPVVIVATRGVESGGFDDLLSILTTAGADQRGTIWLTDRFELTSEDERRDLAGALDAPLTMSADGLRTLALTRLSTRIRDAAGPASIDDPSVTTTSSTTSTSTTTTLPAEPAVDVFTALRDAGFLDFDVPEGQPVEAGPNLTAGTRVVFVSGEKADVPVDEVAVPFASLLVGDRPNVPSVALLALEDRSKTDPPEKEFVVALRRDRDVADRLSTVDNLGDFAGRLAAVLAISDLGDGRVGHYGRGPGAQRLLPAPPEK
jgi:hypothetical protein